jgi:hypothetical protein
VLTDEYIQYMASQFGSDGADVEARKKVDEKLALYWSAIGTPVKRNRKQSADSTGSGSNKKQRSEINYAESDGYNNFFDSDIWSQSEYECQGLPPIPTSSPAIPPQTPGGLFAVVFPPPLLLLLLPIRPQCYWRVFFGAVLALSHCTS